jgi:hypothetical protein
MVEFKFSPPTNVEIETVPVKLHISSDNYEGELL